MGSLLRTWVRSSVLRKGTSNPFWMAIGVLGILNRLRKTLGAPKSIPLINGPIRPGEVIEIRHSGAPSKSLRKERSKRASLVQTFTAVPSNRKGRKFRRRFAGTMVEEFATGKAGSAGSALARLIDPSKAPKKLSRRQRRKANKRSYQAAKALARSTKKAAKRSRKSAINRVVDQVGS